MSTVRASGIPQNSEISRHLAGAHLCDAFAVSISGRSRSALEIYLAIAAQTPTWIDWLMTVRNRAGALFGLKPLRLLGDIDSGKTPSSYRVGDRVGIFSILYLSEDEVVLLEADKHLEAKVSLVRRADANGTSAVMTTVIRVHNLLGRAYMLPVWPVHKLMVPAQLARLVLASHAR